MRRGLVAIALVGAGCGFSEGGTQVEIRALVAPAEPCRWTSAELTILSVELGDTLGLRAAHGEAPAAPEAFRLSLVADVLTAHTLAVRAPPPGSWSSVVVTTGPAAERGWPALEARTSTLSLRSPGEVSVDVLALDGATLGEDEHAVVELRGWTCPGPELTVARPTARWSTATP